LICFFKVRQGRQTAENDLDFIDVVIVVGEGVDWRLGFEWCGSPTAGVVVMMPCLAWGKWFWEGWTGESSWNGDFGEGLLWVEEMSVGTGRLFWGGGLRRGREGDVSEMMTVSAMRWRAGMECRCIGFVELS
jgi:hypothetical protein